MMDFFIPPRWQTSGLNGIRRENVRYLDSEVVFKYFFAASSGRYIVAGAGLAHVKVNGLVRSAGGVSQASCQPRVEARRTAVTPGSDWR